MRNYRDNPLMKMTFQFALNIMEFAEVLREEKRFAFADQVSRAGCSIGANVKEAQSAESKADFIHKMKIASKEAGETGYGLELCNFAKNYSKPGGLLNDIEAILKVLSKTISTTKRKLDEFHIFALKH